jgi:hypothetical protein
MYPPTFFVASCEIWLDVHATKFERVSHIPRGTKIDQRTESSNHSFGIHRSRSSEAATDFRFHAQALEAEKLCATYLRIGGILHYSAADLQAFVMYTNLLPS